MERRKYKYEEELLETNTFKPEISENSKQIINELSKKHYKDDQSAKYLPIYSEKRLKEIENQKKLKLERIKEELSQRELKIKQEEDEILKLVAAKTSSSKYNEKDILDNIEAKFKHYLDKKKKEREENESKYSEITFKPVISDKSKDILKRKGVAKTFRERQVEYENKNYEKKKKLEQQMVPTFKPILNPKSKLMQKKAKPDSTSKPNTRNKHNATKSYENLQIKNQYKYIEDTKRIHEEIQEVDEEDSSNLQFFNSQINRVQNEEIKEISDFINAYKRVNMINLPKGSLKIMDEINDRDDDILDHIVKRNDQSARSDQDDEINNRESEHGGNSIVYETPEQKFKILKDENDDSELENYIEHHSRQSQQIAKNLNNEIEKHVFEEEKEEYEVSKIQHDTNNPLETVGEATIEETTKQNITLEEKTMQNIEMIEPVEDSIKDNSRKGSRVSSKMSISNKNNSKNQKQFNSNIQTEETKNKVDIDNYTVKMKQRNTVKTIPATTKGLVHSNIRRY